MFFLALLGASAVCAAVPTVLFCINLRRFRAPAAPAAGETFAVSVLIPARNEESNIGAVLRGVLASTSVVLEVFVLDDDSADRTAEIVRAIGARDARVRLLQGSGLPPGWNGKQHACWQMAQQATNPVLVFLDADVRVEPELLARMAAFRQRTGTALVSGFPRLVTITWMEKLLLPLIHFVLLAFLPMRAMRRYARPSLSAGCGQFLLVEKEAYLASGGHGAIRETMHDGLLLPRVLRRAGFRTDLADITELASVRMYDSTAKVWQGLAKNATEGIATAGKIVPLSVLLVLGQVVPVVMLLSAAFLLLVTFAARLLGSGGDVFAIPHGSGIPFFLVEAAHGGFVFGISQTVMFGVSIVLFLVALVSVYLPRLLAVRRFRQPLSSALLHPVGILLLLAVQWYALGRKVFGKPVGWRQRTYSSETGTQVS